MKKLFSTLFLLSIILLGALKLALWYFSQEFVVTQIQQIDPLAEVAYESIETSFTGSATIRGIKAYIPLIDQTIHIDSIKIIAPDVKSLLTLDKQLQENNLPVSLTFLMSGLTLNFDSNLMKMLDDPDIERSPVEVISTLACGDIQRINGDSLEKMGYDKIVINSSLNYHFNAHNKTLSYTIKNNILDMSYINLSGVLHDIADLSSLRNQIIRPGKLEIELIDNSYIKQKNRFCANQGKRNIDDYISEHMTQLQKYLSDYGILPEEGLLNAYQAVLKNSASVRIKTNLINLSGTDEISFFDPNDLIQFIQLKLFINDKRINELSLAIDKSKLIETVSNDDIVIKAPDEIKKQRALIAKRYRPVSAIGLRNYNGFRVKITTRSGKHYKGTIITKNPRRYEIITRFRSGNISYFVSPGSIKNAAVFSWR